MDISFLHFVREIFVRFAPNATAISDALEAFLAFRGYKARHQVSQADFGDGCRLNFAQGSLRRRLGQALRWYNVLSDTSAHDMQERVEEAGAAPSNPVNTSPIGKQSQPSEYLHARCPLCFGGRLTHDVGSKSVFPHSPPCRR